MQILVITFFVIGICIGSFLNVIIIRLPVYQSILFTRSKCPICKFEIKWFDNIPILSWFLLLGKCRNCKKNISISYPLIELITGIIFVLTIFSSPSKFEGISSAITLFSGCFLATIFILLSVMDLKYFWLPSIFTIGGLLIGIITSLYVDIIEKFEYFNFFKSSIIAALIGYVIFYVLNILGRLIFKQPVLGSGDAKLVSMIGAWLGIKGMLLSIWLAFNSAGLFVILGLILKKIKRNQKIPFGIFLSFSSFLIWHLGNEKFMSIFNFF